MKKQTLDIQKIGAKSGKYAHKETLTLKEVAEELALDENTIRVYIREGTLPAEKIKRKWKILYKDLDKITGLQVRIEKIVGIKKANSLERGES